MQQRIDTAKRKATYKFDSLAEVSRYVVDAPRTWTTHSSQLTAPSNAWDLSAGYDECVRMARDGWIEGAQKAQKALKLFHPQTPAPDLKYDFYGHMPSVPRYCAGAPDNMIRHTTHANRGGRKVLTLLVPVDANGGVGAKYMSNFGLGLAQYIRQMEADGIRVEVYASIAARMDQRWDVAWTWRVKYADQPLDLAVMAFAIGHPAMLRRLGFAMIERCAAPTSDGYGSVRPMTIADLINAPAGTILVNGMDEADSVARTPEAALAHITAQIDAQRIGKG